jgi:hypothetical protein
LQSVWIIGKLSVVEDYARVSSGLWPLRDPYSKIVVFPD